MHKPKTNYIYTTLTGRRVEFQHNICVVAADKEGAILKECDILGPENNKLPHSRAKIVPSKPSLRGTPIKRKLSVPGKPPEACLYVRLYDKRR